MDDFYAARSRTIPPLPWSNIAPPFSQAFVGQAAYEKYNAFVTFKPESGNWSLQGYVRNIGNKRTKASSVVGSGLAGFPISGSYDPPRTYGVELRYNF